MRLEDFDPPVLNEFKSSAEYHAEIYGPNYERMTPAKLRWLIALSGSENELYHGKGKTRGTKDGVPTKGPKVDKRRFPKKAKRDEKGKVVGPGDEPSNPFPRDCPAGGEQCIARTAKRIVDDYFSQPRPPLDSPQRPPTPTPLHPKDTVRKKAKMPKLAGVDKEGNKVYQAARPTGTYAQTGTKQNWGAEINLNQAADPRVKLMSKGAVAQITALAGQETPTTTAPKTKTTKNVSTPLTPQEKPVKKQKKPGKKRPALPSPEDIKKARDVARRASQSKRRSGEGGGIAGKFESLDYFPSSNIDENISQALYG